MAVRSCCKSGERLHMQVGPCECREPHCAQQNGASINFAFRATMNKSKLAYDLHVGM